MPHKYAENHINVYWQNTPKKQPPSEKIAPFRQGGCLINAAMPQLVGLFHICLMLLDVLHGFVWLYILHMLYSRVVSTTGLIYHTSSRSRLEKAYHAAINYRPHHNRYARVTLRLGLVITVSRAFLFRVSCKHETVQVKW